MEHFALKFISLSSRSDVLNKLYNSFTDPCGIGSIQLMTC